MLTLRILLIKLSSNSWQALLKAEKANETTVDLEAAKKKPTKDDKSDNKPSGDGGDTPNPGGGSSTDSGTDGSGDGLE